MANDKPAAHTTSAKTENGSAGTAVPHASADAIDPSSAEAFIAERRIGERIKHLRLRRSMGLVDLGKRVGLSASFLSQLETGRVVPTLHNLARIAMVFNRDLAYFFDPEPHTLFRIHRKSDRVRLPQSGVEDPSYYFESLAYMVPDRSLDPYYAEFVPTSSIAGMRPHVHPGYEFLYVLDGEIEIRHGEETHEIGSGDAVYFDAATPHSYHCRGERAARALIVTLHQAASTPQTTAHPHAAEESLPPAAEEHVAAKADSGLPQHAPDLDRL